MRDNRAVPVVSALAGLVLLGGVVAFTVVLPDGEGSDHSSTTSENAVRPLELPDELTGGLVAVDLGTLPPELAQNFGDTDALGEQESSIADGLATTFSVAGAFRVYAAEDGSAIAQVTAIDKAPGLFTPDALPIAPDVLGVTRAQAELVNVDGAVCSLDWGQEVPAGQPVPTTPPRGVRCQLGDGERTYELTAQGLTVDESVAALRGLAEA